MKLLLFLLALVIHLLGLTQETKTGYGVIKGIVLTSDQQPAPHVSMVIKNTKEGTTTDENGNFEIKKIKAGIVVLAISLLDHVDTTITVTVLQNETVTLEVRLQRTYAELKAVIVRASLYVETRTSESLRLNLPLNEVPQNIVVTSHQLMSDMGLLSMTEALRTASGVVNTKSGPNDYALIMRGEQLDWPTLYRNGIGGYWWNQQEDVDMIEKIEFVKGPAEFLSGASLGAGMTNLVTKQPVKERIATINAGFGSFNLMRVTTDLGGALTKKGKLSYRFNAGVHDQHRSFQYAKAIHYFVCPVLKYDFNSKTSVTAEYNYMWAKTSGNNDWVPSINGELFVLPKNFAVADDKNHQLIVADNYYRVQLKHDFNANWHLNAQLAYVNGKWGGSLMSSSGSFPVTNDTLYRYANYDDWRNFSKVALGFVDGKFNTGKKIEHKVLFGTEFNHWGVTDSSWNTSNEKKFGVYLPMPDYYVHPDSLKNYFITDSSKLRLKSIAFYAQDNIKISGKLIITLAGRYTHSSLTLLGYGLPVYQEKTNYDVFTPRAGLTWLFTGNLSVYALYDQFFYPQFGRNANKKPFKPLTGYNLESGMKSFFFNKKLGLNFSIYHTVLNNTVTADLNNPPFDKQTGQIVSNGIDFDLTGHLTSALVVNANYEYSDAKITKDSDTSIVGVKNFGAPAHIGNLWMKYNLLHGKLKGIFIALGYQYMGTRNAAYDKDKAKFLPAHHLLDAALGYSNKQFNINLNVYNITNTNYAAIGNFNDNINEWRYTPGEPVNFRLSIGINLLQNKNKIKTQS